MANLLKFGDYTPEAAEQEAKQLGGNDFLKLEVGKTRLRVMPPPPGENSPMRVVPQHAVEVPDQQYPIRFQCPGKGCPACAEAQRLSRTGNPKDRERAYQMGVRQRVFCLAISRKEEERGPLVWEFGKKIHEQLKKLRLNDDAGGNFSHPYEGFDVIVEREGTGKNDTTYTLFPARQSTPLHADEEQMVEWCDNRPDLDRYTRLMSIDEVKKLLGAEDDEGAEEAPRKQLAGKKAKTRTAEDDIDA